MDELTALASGEQALAGSQTAPQLSYLDRECIAFSRYLTDLEPNGYVREKYREAHAIARLGFGTDISAFDRFLLKLSTWHPVAAKLVDSYTGVFLRQSAVRKKWILLLAILESCAPTYRRFDSPDAWSRPAFCARMLWRGAVFLAALSVSFLLFTPVRLFLVWCSRPTSKPRL